MQTIQAIWRRIEIWLAHDAPDLLNQLRPGATEEEIRQAERLMHLKLPKEVRASMEAGAAAETPLVSGGGRG